MDCRLKLSRLKLVIAMGEKIITLEPLRRLFINEQDSTGDSTEITPTLNQIKYITVTDNLHSVLNVRLETL